MFQIIGRTAKRQAARIERERREAREARRWQAVETFPGVDGARVAVVSPWVARAQAGQLPASDRTFGR